MHSDGRRAPSNRRPRQARAAARDGLTRVVWNISTRPSIFPPVIRTLAIALALALLMPGTAAAQAGLRDIGRDAATNNHGILADRAGLDARTASARAARRAFAPELELTADYVSDLPGFAESTRRRRVDYAGGVRWRTPYGSVAEVTASATEQLAGTLSGHDATLLFALSQSLLDGGWRSGAFTQPALADVDAEIQRQLYLAALNSLLVDVEAAYWELAFADADLAIKTRSRDRAQVQFEATQENIRRGLLAEADIFVVEENLVFFESQLARARQARLTAQRRLARLLAANTESPYTPADALAIDDRLQIPAGPDAVATAIERNPSLISETLRVRRAQIALAFEDNRALPQLDLRASLALNGLAGADDPTWAQVFAGERVDARAGVVFSVPLAWDPDRAAVDRASSDKRAALERLAETESEVRFSVADLLTALDTGHERLALARRLVKLAESKLSAEVDKYENGISTLNDVVRFQRDLDSSLIGARRIEVDLRVTRARLSAAMGTLHLEYGLEVR